MPDFGTNQSNSVEVFTNKLIDASANTFTDLWTAPHVKDCGQMQTTFAATSTIGLLINLSALGTPSIVALDSNHSFAGNWVSAASAGSNAGVNSQPFTYRNWNPYARIKFAIPTVAAQTRLLMGFMNTATLPGNTDTFWGSGVPFLGFGFRTSDSNFMIFHNDASGAMTATALGTPTAKDNAVRVVEFIWNNSVPNCIVNLYGSGGLASTNTITTDLVPSGTALNFCMFSNRSDSTANNARIYNIWFEHTRTTAPL